MSRMNGNEIIRLRERIDKIDGEILAALERRASLSVTIGRLKKSRGVPTADLAREQDLMREILRLNTGPLSDSALRHIFVEIISACRALQAPTTVAYLGPEGTFSHQATLQWFGRSADLLPQHSIADIFREVERNHTDFGIVPVENSAEGAVGAALDQLAASDVAICGELYVRISHSLMSNVGDLADVKTVYSHPQALGQCIGWLSANLPGRPLVPVASTSAAGLKAAEEPEAACVGSEVLANLYGLKILARDIQDLALNQTRFHVLGSGNTKATGRDKTSILFAVAHKPGALREALTPFAERAVNLLRIESRPAKQRPWEYIFFVDLEGHRLDDRVAAALKELSASVTRFKFLGSYPAAEPLVHDKARAEMQVSGDAQSICMPDPGSWSTEPDQGSAVGIRP